MTVPVGMAAGNPSVAAPGGAAARPSGQVPAVATATGDGVIRVAVLGIGRSGPGRMAGPGPGTSVLLRTLPATGTAVAPGRPFTAIVIGRDAGLTLLSTPFGTRGVPAGATLRPGAILGLCPVRGMEPSVLLRHSDAARAFADFASGWPNLRSAIERLAAGDPALAARALGAVPRPGPAFLAQLARFVAGVNSRSLERWLGSEPVAALRASGDAAVAEVLLRDLERLGRLADSDPDWRTMLVPLWDGRELRQIRLALRRPPEREHTAPAGLATRFLIDIDLRCVGPMQLDGFYRERRLSLLVRSTRCLDPRLRERIRAIFLDSVTATGITGDIRFAAEPPMPIMRSTGNQ